MRLRPIEIIKRPSGGYNKENVVEIKESSAADLHPEQIKRQQNAMTSKCKPTSIDYDAKSAVFIGSGKKPYEATFNSCTCRDYFVRRLPCKHIYRLRYELNKAEDE